MKKISTIAFVLIIMAAAFSPARAQDFNPILEKAAPAKTVLLYRPLDIVLRSAKINVKFSGITLDDRLEGYVCPKNYTFNEHGRPKEFFGSINSRIGDIGEAAVSCDGTCFELEGPFQGNYGDEDSPVRTRMDEGSYDIVLIISRGDNYKRFEIEDYFTIKDVQASEAVLDDKKTKVQVSGSMAADNTVLITVNPYKGIYDNKSDSELYIKLDKNVEDLTVFLTPKGTGIADYLIYLPITDDPERKVQNSDDVTLDILKGGVTTNDVLYRFGERDDFSRFYSGTFFQNVKYFTRSDNSECRRFNGTGNHPPPPELGLDCGGEYILNDGEYDAQIIYVKSNDKVYYKRFTIKVDTNYTDTTAIKQLKLDLEELKNGNAKIYNLKGQQLPGLQEGAVNIIKYDNGTTKKVFVK